jgi:hypothetical protein
MGRDGSVGIVTGLRERFFVPGGNRQWLKCYAKSRRVVGSIPDEVTFFSLPNP